MLYNGKIQLYYLTSSLKPLSAVLPSLDADNFLTVVANLFADIIDVKHNGFLSCRNIDIDFDRIYVEPTTYKVQLVYLPISERLFQDNASFESELRTNLVRLINSMLNLSNMKTMQLSMDLSNGMLSLEELCARIKGGKLNSAVVPEPVAPKIPTMRITTMNAPQRTEFMVTKTPYTLGKNPSLVDGAIIFNKMISRVHCRITREGGDFAVTDLQSANGTFVNSQRLQANQPCVLKNGDILRLANSDFQVSID